MNSNFEIDRPIEKQETEDVRVIFDQAIQTLEALTGLTTNNVEQILDNLKIPKVGSKEEDDYYNKYYFDSSDLPIVKIPDEAVKSFFEGLIKGTDSEIRERTEMEDWDLMYVLSGLSKDQRQKETIKRQLLNEMSYRYFVAREILAPIIFHWVNSILLDASKEPGSKIVFLYRDAYLAETFARFMIRNGYVDGVTEDQLVVCNISRANVGHKLLNEYIQQQVGIVSRSIFLVDTGISGSLIKPFADLYPEATLHAKYFVLKSTIDELGLDSSKVHLDSYSHDLEDEIGYEHIEETCIPPIPVKGGINPEFMSRAYSFERNSSGEIVPIYNSLRQGSFGSNNGDIENLYLQSYRAGYFDYLEQIKKGFISTPSQSVEAENLLHFGRRLIGTDDNPGMNIIRSILPHSSLTPATDDIAELIKLREAFRNSNKPENINYNDNLI